MNILGIESSCDETSAAIVKDGKEILSNVIYSQATLHARFNGVVPEVASRKHLEKILPVIDEAMSGYTWDEIDAIAVSNGPGLIGALLVGLSTAKALSYVKDLPLIPVNHVYAHLYAPHLTNYIEFPYIGLVASGGHTLLFDVKSFDEMNVMGSTIDDAVGEAFDKVAKLLGLGYPGGPKIDKAAQNGDENFLDMPRGLADKKDDLFNFSYSGLKTAVAYRIKDMELNTKKINDIAASFQKTAIELLLRKTKNALKATGYQRLVVAGGVAANSYLRKKLEELKTKNVKIFPASLELCGDNAAMVAGRGYADYQAGKIGGPDTDAYSRLPFVKKGKRVVL